MNYGDKETHNRVIEIIALLTKALDELDNFEAGIAAIHVDSAIISLTGSYDPDRKQ